MFDLLFGWRKASKCKKLIKRVQCRLRLLKNKRQSIVRQLREDVANLIKIGRANIALNRAEHLHKDGCLIAAYDLLDNFCEFILIQLPYIRKHRDCPNDINEAVSSLIFASARCGDLPELRKIRKLFGERYGKRFEMTALELMPGNLVNLQVKEKLSDYSVPVDVKKRLVDEIASDYCLRPETLMLEYTVKDAQHSDSRAADSQDTEALRTNDPEGKALFLDPDSACLSLNLPSLGDLRRDEIPSPMSYASHHSTPDFLESSLHNRTENLQNLSRPNCPLKNEAILLCTKESPRYRENRYTTASSSESFPPFQEEAIEYLDDIEEVQSSTATEGICQDQRIFKFKSSAVPKSEKIKDSCHVQNEDHDELSSRSSNGRKRVKTRRKRLRARFATQYVLYYQRSCLRYPSYRSRSRSQTKYQKKYLIATSKLTAEMRRNPPHSCHCSDVEAEDFCLKHPCYFCTYDCLHNHKIPPLKKSREIPTLYCPMNEESDSVMERFFFAHRPRRRSCESDPLQHDPTSTSTSKMTKPPYLRAMTMPQQQPREDQGGNVKRTRSFPVQTPGHVHPKLPDYDTIEAQFMALKKEHVTGQRRWKPISF